MSEKKYFVTVQLGVTMSVDVSEDTYNKLRSMAPTGERSSREALMELPELRPLAEELTGNMPEGVSV